MTLAASPCPGDVFFFLFEEDGAVLWREGEGCEGEEGPGVTGNGCDGDRNCALVKV